MVESLAREHLGLIVGPHGTGKSTLIETLHPALAARYGTVTAFRFNRDPSFGLQQRLAQSFKNATFAMRMAWRSPRGGLVVLDGLEQLSVAVRFSFIFVLRIRGCDLLATSHHRLRGFVVLRETRMTRGLILRLAGDLLADADDGCRERVGAELERRDLDVVSDARGLWFELYDVAATPSPNQ